MGSTPDSNWSSYKQRNVHFEIAFGTKREAFFVKVRRVHCRNPLTVVPARIKFITGLVASAFLSKNFLEAHSLKHIQRTVFIPHYTVKPRIIGCFAGRAHNYYAVGSRLGEGGCGSVFGAKRISDGLPVALKLVEKTEWDQFGSPWEVQLMSLMNRNTGHPNVLRLYEWFDAPEYYVMVLERPEPCQDLSDFCSPKNKLDEELAPVVTQQLLDALPYCQQSGVFHRDVKPVNVLINTDTNHVTLINFGVRTNWTDTPYTFAGTLVFTPPEWFWSGVYQAGPATVWSLGVTLYNFVCGYLPYNPHELPDTMGIIFYPEELSPPMVDVMKRCLTPQVELRASLEGLQYHPWLSTSCIQSVGFRKWKRGPEEVIQQRRRPSYSPVPPESLQKDDDVDNVQSWIQSLPPSSTSGVSRGSKEELLSNHGCQSAVPDLNQDQS